MTVQARPVRRSDAWLFQPDYEPRRPASAPAQRLPNRYRIAAAVLGVAAGLLWWQLRETPSEPRPSRQQVRTPQAPPTRRVRTRVAGWRAETPAKHRVHGIWKRVWVTAYCPECRVCDTTDTTATGRSAEGPGAAVAARGRRAMPLGSRVYVSNLGWMPVDDTGGEVRSDQIDVRMQSHGAARRWGRRRMSVRVEGAGG